MKKPNQPLEPTPVFARIRDLRPDSGRGSSVTLGKNKPMKIRFMTIVLLTSVAMGAEERKSNPIPRFEEMKSNPIPRFESGSLRATISALSRQSKKDSVPRWYELGRSKGVILAKVEMTESVAFVFLPGSNSQVFSAELVRRAEVFGSLDAAVQFVRVKPPDVHLTIFKNGLKDGQGIPHLLSPSDLTQAFSKSETEAFEAVLSPVPPQQKPNQSPEPTSGLRPAAAHL
jgi:hypothetical protein